MRLGAMRLLCVLAACHLAGALRVAPPVTTRRALLSQLAAATSLASTPAFAQQAAQQAAPEAVVRPPIKVATAEQQAELEKARSAIPVPEPPKGSDLDRMLATGGSFGVLDHAAPLPR
jgi:hypothetical protein